MKHGTAPLAVSRAKLGLTQPQAAAKIGVSALHLLRVERGSEALSDRMAAKLAELLGLQEKAVRAMHTSARRQYLRELAKKA